MKKTLLLLIASALLLGLLAACGTTGNTTTQPKITVVLDWTPNANHAGLYAAQSLGYFEDEGLDVSIVQPPEDGALPLVASGGAEFGVSFQEEVIGAVTAEKPLPVSTVAAILQHNDSGIISLKKKGITDPSKLENHTYASYGLPIELAMLRRIVETGGADYSKVRIVPNAAVDVASALESGIDSIWVYYAVEGIACETLGLETNYFAFRDIDPVFDFYTPVIVGSTKYLNEHPDEAEAFLRAVRRGYEYSAANSSETAELMIKAVPELSGDILPASMRYIAPKFIDDAEYWGKIDTARWDRFNNWLYEQGLLNNQPVSGESLWNKAE